MIIEVTLEKIYINTTKKDGGLLIDKNGNPYALVSIETSAGNKATMFCGKYGAKDLEIVKTWQPQDKVRIIIEQNGEYYNFKLPNKTDELEARVAKIEAFLEKHGLE